MAVEFLDKFPAQGFCLGFAGFDPAAVEAGHVGLRLMADLAHSLGGTLTITSSPGAGTMVRMVVPR